jgi:hypothetical protein
MDFPEMDPAIVKLAQDAFGYRPLPFGESL